MESNVAPGEARNRTGGGVPFAGLGFDLTGARAAAQTVCARLVRVEDPQPARPREAPPAGRHGFGLMLMLGRQTLGS